MLSGNSDEVTSIPDLTDGDFALGFLDGNLFPGIGFGSSVLVHNGFAASQSRPVALRTSQISPTDPFSAIDRRGM